MSESAFDLEKEKEELRELQSQVSKEHGGKIPKDSEIAKKQSEIDRKIALQNVDDQFTVIQGLKERQGGKPMQGIDENAIEGKWGYMDAIQKEEEHLEEKMKAIAKEFEETPRFANTTLPTRK